MNSLWPLTVKSKEGNYEEQLLRLKGGCIALNLNDTYKFGSYVGNQTDSYHNLCFYTSGDAGEYQFKDDMDI